MGLGVCALKPVSESESHFSLRKQRIQQDEKKELKAEAAKVVKISYINSMLSKYYLKVTAMAKSKFYEEQRFCLWRIAGLTALLLMPLASVWYAQMQTTGRHTGATDGLVMISLICLFAMAGFWAYVLLARLRTEVDENSIRYQFFPAHRDLQAVDWDEVAACRVYKTGLWSHLSGWGVSYATKQGPRFSVTGQNGVELQLKNGERIFLGSHQPRRLGKTVRKVMKKKGMLAE